MTERAQSWRNAFYAGSFFGLAFGLIGSYSNGWLPPTSPGAMAAVVTQIVVSGGLFGLFIGLFMRSAVVPKAADIAIETGEVVEYSGLANHFLNLEGRGGRLALTKTHLVFKPHVVNLQRSELRIPRICIVGAHASRTLGIVPNGLTVTLNTGKVERFVVNDRMSWVEKLARK
jgi:hypothetical protein